MLDRDEGGDVGRCSTVESFVGDKFKVHSIMNGKLVQGRGIGVAVGQKGEPGCCIQEKLKRGKFSEGKTNK